VVVLLYTDTSALLIPAKQQSYLVRESQNK